jgi:Protein of unknown function (DUF4058)
MPLRDHFRPPVEKRHSWDELHGGWPMIIVQKLFPQLPDGYVAAPGVHLGAAFEIDVSTYEQDEPIAVPIPAGSGGVAVASHAPPQPTLTLETELPDQDEYEVRIYDERHGRRLVAAIELISPANKDRPESRRAFVGKVATLLQHNVCVSLVDIVTIRDFNLYADVLEFIGGNDPALESKPSYLYAVTIRGRKPLRRRSLLETWFYPLHLGQPLPTLPIWLDVDLNIDLELEPSYEETCRYLRIS